MKIYILTVNNKPRMAFNDKAKATKAFEAKKEESEGLAKKDLYSNKPINRRKIYETWNMHTVDLK